MEKELKKLLNELLIKNKISTDIELNLASMLDRKLNLLGINNSTLKEIRIKLKNIISDYEKIHHPNNSYITEEKIIENDNNEKIAEFLFCELIKNNKIGGSAYYENIHETIRKLIIDNKFDDLNDFLELFKESKDLGAIKTILIITKSFKKHPQISKVREELRQIFDDNIC